MTALSAVFEQRKRTEGTRARITAGRVRKVDEQRSRPMACESHTMEQHDYFHKADSSYTARSGWRRTAGRWELSGGVERRSSRGAAQRIVLGYTEGFSYRYSEAALLVASSPSVV